MVRPAVVVRRVPYALAVFLGALLLFLMQPMLGKRLLPWFGGSPATWTACMLFFQLLLFAGYAWADVLVRRCSARTQAVLQASLLLAACVALPLGPEVADRPLLLDHPLTQILALLWRHAALPYFALATTAPLLQHWFERETLRSPYALYAFSNAGSLLGLLAYPLLIEPWLALGRQTRLWSVGFALFALVMLWLAVRGVRDARGSRATVAVAPVAELSDQRASWFWLALLPSALLLAITSYITVDVAPLPLFWVVPLLLYLLSFVLVFSSGRFYRRAVFLPLWVACTAALGVSSFLHGTAPLGFQLVVCLGSLFVCCMCCHGELARLRPEASQLSRFYLWVAAGGAGGGVFVGVIAPLVFKGFFELQVTVIATYAVLFVLVWREPASQRKRGELRALWLGVGLAVPLVAATIWVQSQDRTRGGVVIEQRRSFYGVLRVTQLADVTLFSHGRIRHGMQFRDEARAGEPTFYFGPQSGAGRALRLHAIDHPRRIGVLGLGIGTLACYGRPGDRMRFYELSPDVVAVAASRFSFLARSAAAIETVVGDARLSLEREPPQGFDLLLLDAFSSDSVPAHLLTVEAFSIYLRHLRQDGLLLANVSNRHLDVERVVAGAARRHHLALRLLDTPSDAEHGYTRVRWALMSRDAIELDRVLAGGPRTELHGTPLAWTDDFSNLLQVLR
ncbi:MAG: spermidine synthase [Polyangiales bacterium]